MKQKNKNRTKENGSIDVLGCCIQGSNATNVAFFC